MKAITSPNTINVTLSGCAGGGLPSGAHKSFRNGQLAR